MKGLTEKQKTLPPGLQKAILAKQEKDDKGKKKSVVKPKPPMVKPKVKSY